MTAGFVRDHPRYLRARLEWFPGSVHDGVTLVATCGLLSGNCTKGGYQMQLINLFAHRDRLHTGWEVCMHRKPLNHHQYVTGKKC
jgi:hypothetical protein